MPVFTDAPLPLLYGCRMTRAPAAAARGPVSSDEPSSTTTISFQAAAARRAATTSLIASASSNAGTITDVAAASAMTEQPLDDGIPRNSAGHVFPILPERSRERTIG